ncbi:hypothetical protein GGX14DRAFT_390066 [Mycena pura]|uniref:Uncharacterized protein n=1 Tax=Mycena pura TaxID=153505 RepID=A0AAD6VRC3_9AGAR|nr:hypothetical protein GGX14DRAFT_390066 [Mycena pura]
MPGTQFQTERKETKRKERYYILKSRCEMVAHPDARAASKRIWRWYDTAMHGDFGPPAAQAAHSEMPSKSQTSSVAYLSVVPEPDRAHYRPWRTRAPQLPRNLAQQQQISVGAGWNTTYRYYPPPLSRTDLELGHTGSQNCGFDRDSGGDSRVIQNLSKTWENHESAESQQDREAPPEALQPDSKSASATNPCLKQDSKKGGQS